MHHCQPLTFSARLELVALDDLNVQLIDVVDRSLGGHLIHGCHCLLGQPSVRLNVAQGLAALLQGKQTAVNAV